MLSFTLGGEGVFITLMNKRCIIFSKRAPCVEMIVPDNPRGSLFFQLADTRIGEWPCARLLCQPNGFIMTIVVKAWGKEINFSCCMPFIICIWLFAEKSGQQVSSTRFEGTLCRELWKWYRLLQKQLCERLDFLRFKVGWVGGLHELHRFGVLSIVE